MNDFDEEMYNVDEFADDVNQNHEESSQDTNSSNEEDLTNDLLGKVVTTTSYAYGASFLALYISTTGLSEGDTVTVNSIK